MTKKFCDRCGVETTSNQAQVVHPYPFTNESKRLVDVCKDCQKLFLEVFQSFIERRSTATPTKKTSGGRMQHEQ